VIPIQPEQEQPEVIDLAARRPKAMSEPPTDRPARKEARDEDEEDEGDRRVSNLVIGLFVVVLIALGVWLVDALLEQRRIDDCVAQGRRNCGQITTPGRE
jgi:hypothetical protein